MTQFLWICLAGAFGTGSRYLFSLWIPRPTGGFPWAILAVNIAGSFLIGGLSEIGPGALSPSLRLALTVGLLGGFTTYSAFNQETLEAIRSGAWLSAALYASSTLVGCLLAGGLGIATGRVIAN